MPNANYERGRRFEWKTRDRLVAAGCAVAARTAGSKTKVDLFGLAAGVVFLVQCKADGKISPAERKTLLSLAALNPAVTIPVLATQDGFFLLTGPGPKERVAIDVEDIIRDVVA